MKFDTPNTIRQRPVGIRQCIKCGELMGKDQYAYSKSVFFPDQVLPICNNCVKQYLIDNDFSWDSVDRLCRYADIPFVPSEFERLKEMNGEDTFPVYAAVFQSAEYNGIDWSTYFEAFKELQRTGLIENEIPLVRDKRIDKLKEKWGMNYDEEELAYLENLYNGILSTQNVTGALQVDQAEKLCRISLEIDSKIRGGESIDKLLASYEKLVKVAEFTPKNAKNASDFDSVGELFRWLEKRGWVNKYYDNVTRDIVDETIKNHQAYGQRLYTNESGIGDEINRRIEALKTAKEAEQTTDYYDLQQEYDVDEFENAGYEGLMNDNFEVELE